MIRAGAMLALCSISLISALPIGQEEEQHRLYEAVINNDMYTIGQYVYTTPQNPNPALDMYRYYSPVYGWQEVPHNSMLHIAATYGQHGIIGILIDYGVDVNIRNAHGETPLHKAAQHGQWHIVRTLLHAGADTNAEDGTGNTPLSSAFTYARQRMNPQEIWKSAALLVSEPIEKLESKSYTRRARKGLRDMVGTTIAYLKDMYHRL